MLRGPGAGIGSRLGISKVGRGGIRVGEERAGESAEVAMAVATESVGLDSEEERGEGEETEEGSAGVVERGRGRGGLEVGMGVGYSSGDLPFRVQPSRRHTSSTKVSQSPKFA